MGRTAIKKDRYFTVLFCVLKGFDTCNPLGGGGKGIKNHQNRNKNAGKKTIFLYPELGILIGNRTLILPIQYVVRHQFIAITQPGAGYH